MTIKNYQNRQDYIKYANSVEKKYGIPNNMLVGLLQTESGFKEEVIKGKKKSSAGAIGIAQFMPKTAKSFGIDPTDPFQSIDAAGKYLYQNQKILNNWDDTLRSYNMGLGGVQAWKKGKRELPKETEEYVAKVYKNGNLDFTNKQPVQTQEEVVYNLPSKSTTIVNNLPKSEESVNFAEQVNKLEQDNLKRQAELEKAYEQVNNSFQYKQPSQEEQVVYEEQTPNVNYEDIFNQVSQFVDTPIAQQGLSKDEKQKEDVEWLTNWYRNRILPQTDLQNIYLEDKDIYLSRMGNTPNVEYVDNIDNNPYITGRYNGDKIFITKGAENNVHLHEMTHYSDDFPSAMRTVHKRVVDFNKAPKELTKGIYNEKYDYFTDPDEVHARIQVLRKNAGIKPDQEVSSEFLDNFLKDYKRDNENINDLLNIADPPHILEMLNYMASRQPLNKDNYIAQQGNVINDNMGQWKYPGEITRISSPNITMKDVPYQVLGIADTGEVKLMLPNQEYYFNNASTVTEYPLISESKKKYLKKLKNG